MIKKMNGTVLFAIIVIVIFLSASCKSVLKLTGNYNNPKNETSTSVLEYLKAQKAKYDEVFIPRSKTAMKYILDSINGYMPAIIVFDRDFKNYIIDYKCFAAKPTGLDSIMSTGSWIKDSSHIHERLLNRLMAIDKDYTATEEPKDVYIYYLWAKYFPKKSNDLILENSNLYNALHNRVYIASVNMDIQKSW